ncbi:MAG: hypothetical protein SRB2_02091 [Desulfobacteraceae bacterium Eth-SRB2]|nr:MAG: hypothetical protein SRB2_02091 [Desulfobacteraceae bacterium Eth-SRB2]
MISLRFECLPRIWNNGIVEFWKVGFKRILASFNFIVNTNFTINPILHYPITHYSIIPAFHHSNWGETPNLMRIVLFFEHLKNQFSGVMSFYPFLILPAFHALDPFPVIHIPLNGITNSGFKRFFRTPVQVLV